MIGSKTETNKEAEARAVSAIDTFETFIASKKKTQCNAVIQPVSTYLVPLENVVASFLFDRKTKSKIPAEAISMRHQTSDMLEIEMSLPRIPVKPQRNTIA